MARYARIDDALTVSEWVNLDDPSTIAPQKKRPDGGLHIRPVVGNDIPRIRPEIERINTTIKVEVDRVVVTNNVEMLGEDYQRAAVKAECRRRIFDRFPDWKQANMTARAVELLHIGEANWTDEHRAEISAMQDAWSWIKQLRAKSDALEAVTPIPRDYDADKYWTV